MIKLILPKHLAVVAAEAESEAFGIVVFTILCIRSAAEAVGKEILCSAGHLMA